MAKKKKKNSKQNSFYKAVKPYIKDNRILFSILGAAGLGVAIASAVGTDRLGSFVTQLTDAFQNPWGKDRESIANSTGNPVAGNPVADKEQTLPKSTKAFTVS